MFTFILMLTKLHHFNFYPDMELTNAHNSDVSPHTTLFMVIFENEFEDFSFPIIFYSLCALPVTSLTAPE